MAQTRIDVYLVQKGFAPSRTKAQDLIKEGAVSVRAGQSLRTIITASELIDEDLTPEIVIAKNAVDKYVSRAGLKMQGALEFLRFPVDGLRVLDVGISTGGFTDCLLQRGASHVVGVDVGHNQLAHRLKSDPRISCFEGVNARELDKEKDVLKQMPSGGFDLIVIDVSFISLTLILPAIPPLLKTWGHVLALVKPQFELGPDRLGKGGIVKDQSLFDEVEQKIRKAADSAGVEVKTFFPSSTDGRDGNKEFFILGKKK